MSVESSMCLFCVTALGLVQLKNLLHFLSQNHDFLVHVFTRSAPVTGGSMDGASHQCGPGSIPGPGVICGLSLLLVLVLAPRVFLWVLRFPPSIKTNISKFQFHLLVRRS